MKKYLLLILSLLLILTVTFAFASCGGGDDDVDDDDDVETEDDESDDDESGDGDPTSPPTSEEIAAISFNDKTVTYNGSAHSVLVGSKPSGVTVQYEGNSKTDAGEYTVTAKFYFGGEYIVGADKTAKLTINKADYDMSGVSFTGSTKTYDGQAVVPAISGTLPAGVEVSYDADGRNLTDAGSYTVTANFTVDANHNPIAPITANYVINKATFDASKLLKNKSVNFNGEYHSLTPSVTVPSYITVTYENNNVRAIGTHTVVAKFSADPDNVIIPEPVKALLIINKGSYKTDGIEYTERTDGTYEVSGYTGTDECVIIPDKYLNVAVTSIKSSAFEGKTTVEYVYMPNSVTNIGNKAFSGCTNLVEVRLGSALTNIGMQAFAGSGLKDIKIPDNVTSIGRGAYKNTAPVKITLPFVGGSRESSNKYLGFLFDGNDNSCVPSTLKTVVFSDGCTEIPAYSFNGCVNVSEFVIGENVETLGSSAFANCTSLRSIYIPETLTTILANAEWANSPFMGCASDLMIVMESDINLGFGQYWCNLTATQKALVIYMKEYEDYLENGESFRDVDVTDATLKVIYLGNSVISGFDATKLEYTAAANINTGYPDIRAYASSAAARVLIDAPTVANGGVATITVISGDENVEKIYKVQFSEITGSLNTKNEIVNKDGADATVSFVIDDGQKTNFHKNMLQKYSKLSLTFAIWTKDFATLTETADGSAYVMDGDKYTYTQTQTQKDTVEFWKDIMLIGRSEIVSHTHTHAFWGTNDDGGKFDYVKNDNTYVAESASFPKGSSSKEIYASKQIIEEIFGGNSYLGQNNKNLVIIHAGIGVQMSNKTVNGKVVPTYYTYYTNVLNEAMANGDYIGGRGTFQVTTTAASKSKVTTPSMMKDLNYRRSINAYMIVTENRNSGGHWSDGGIDNWTAYIDHAIDQNGLAAYCIHNIIPNPTSHSGHNISEADAEALYAYALSKNVWVATFTDAMMYYSEWSTAKVNSTYADGKITVTLTDSEKNDVFDMALTIKVNVPFNWESAKMDGQALEVHRAADGSAYVYANIVPDSGAKVITEG